MQQDVSTRAEPGSFRDRDSRVFVTPEGVFRALSARGLEDFEALSAPSCSRMRPPRGTLVARRSPTSPRRSCCPARRRPRVLAHERLPFISYPYEWTFGMLRDAGAAAPRPARRGAREGLTMKDASPYNVQWRGAPPVFADLGSFEVLRRERAVDRLPPVLHAVPVSADAAGLPRRAVPPVAARLARGHPADGDGAPLSKRDRLAQGRADARRAARAAGAPLRVTRFAQARSRGAPPGGLQAGDRAGQPAQDAQARRAPELEAGHTAWTDYGAGHRGYDEADREAKQRFVAAAAERAKPRLAWDLGTNDGVFARIAAALAELRGRLGLRPRDRRARSTRRCATEGDRKILPLVVDLTDPSPGRGWRGRRAPDARAARQAGADTQPGADPPPLDHAQRAGRRGGRLAGVARRHARHRVPAARGHDGPALLERQARRGPPGLRPRVLRALPRAAVRGPPTGWSSARACCSRRWPGDERHRRPSQTREAAAAPQRRAGGHRLAVRPDDGRAPRGAVGARVRAAAVRPARQERGVLRGPRQHPRGHPDLRARLRARPAAGRHGRAGAREPRQQGRRPRAAPRPDDDPHRHARRSSSSRA